jgi:hypothetical protein
MLRTAVRSGTERGWKWAAKDLSHYAQQDVAAAAARPWYFSDARGDAQGTEFDDGLFGGAFVDFCSRGQLSHGARFFGHGSDQREARVRNHVFGEIEN